jgi:hypothetical protein
MNNKFTVAWSFRNRLDILIDSIKTADNTCPKEVDFCLVDAASSTETITKLREFCNTISNRVVRICESSYRTSLSEAWNLAFMLTENRYVIFASSDVHFIKEGWYNDFVKAMCEQQMEYVLMENHSVFCIDKKAIPKMGWFDEHFIAGPHFDVDYMIRASENGVKFNGIGNNGYYSHFDEPETTKQRLSSDVKDRLPMNDLTNERLFKEKWLSGWSGWEQAIKSGQVHLPHPPTHISQVRRMKPEIDYHPIYTQKYK